MAGQEDFTKKTFPWARMGFDLEGIAGAVASWLVGLLLGMLWGPLFWIGFAGALVCLFATRRAGRTPPERADAVVAPCDGVVVEISEETPPAELRLTGDLRTRIRISSSPASPTGLFAPIAGGVETLVREEGDPSRVAATNADAFGMAGAFIALSSGETEIGLRIVTGGLGPRLDMDVEAGDAVRAGRRIGKRRLGGWCDVYLPAGFVCDLQPGMTVVGAETQLGDWRNETLDTIVASSTVTAPAPRGGGFVEDADDAEEDGEQDAAALFAKLRRGAEKAGEDES